MRDAVRRGRREDSDRALAAGCVRPKSGGPGGGGQDPDVPPGWIPYGPKDPVTGLYRGYTRPKADRDESRVRWTWGQVYGHWPLLEVDLHERFGIDLEDREMLSRRSWRWLRTRIHSLMHTDSRLCRAIKADQADAEQQPPPKPE